MFNGIFLHCFSGKHADIHGGVSRQKGAKSSANEVRSSARGIPYGRWRSEIVGNNEEVAQVPASGCRATPKELTPGDCGPRKELPAASCRRMTRSTKVARRRGQDHKICDQGNVVQETRKGRTFEERRWNGPECNNGIRDRGWRQQLRGSKRMKDLGGRRPLCLRKERATRNGIGGWSSGRLKKTVSEIFRGKIARQVVGTSSGLRRMMDWALWRGRPPPKRKKQTASSVSDNFPPPVGKRKENSEWWWCTRIY
jgi:hypothetical protein